MRQVNGIELCKRVVDQRPDVPVVVLTAFGKLGHRGRRHPRGRVRFHQQARRDRGPCDRHRSRDEASPARRGGQASPRRGRPSPRARVRRRRRGQRGDARGARDLVGRLAESEASVLISGRDGDGQEGRRPPHPPVEPPRKESRSSPSTAPPCPRASSRASSSDTRRARSPTPRPRSTACSPKRAAGRSSSTRSATCPSESSRSSCGCFRSGRCGPSVAKWRSPPTFGC